MYKTNIISNFYVDNNPERMKELVRVYAQNTSLNANIRFVMNKTDSYIFKEFDWAKKDNVFVSILEHNPSFKDMFRILRNDKLTNNNTISIIINSDIMFFQSDLDLIENNLKEAQCFALSRWDMVDDNPENALLVDRIDSQDAWCFKGPPPVIDEEFNMGVPGCDNKIAYLIKQEGYSLYNPCRSIKVYHNHICIKRNRNLITPVPPPYTYISPLYLEEILC